MGGPLDKNKWAKGMLQFRNNVQYESLVFAFLFSQERYQKRYNGTLKGSPGWISLVKY